MEKRTKNTWGSVNTCFQLGVWVNVALTCFKFFAGIAGGSRAMVADSLHSTSDVIATIIVWLAYRSSKKPADDTHPYGHEGIESLAAIFVSLLLIITGGYMTYSSIILIARHAYRGPSGLALAAAVVSIIIKEAMYHYTIWIARRENSPALLSNAWDHRSDVFSSIAAFLVIMGAMSGRAFLDPAAGILIAALFIQLAYKILRENLGRLIDEPPEPELLNKFKCMLEQIEGVKGIGDFKVRRRGSMYYIDLTIYVAGRLTVEQGHAVAETVEEKLLNSGNRVFSSMVHVEPDPSLLKL